MVTVTPPCAAMCNCRTLFLLVLSIDHAAINTAMEVMICADKGTVSNHGTAARKNTLCVGRNAVSRSSMFTAIPVADQPHDLSGRGVILCALSGQYVVKLRVGQFKQGFKCALVSRIAAVVVIVQVVTGHVVQFAGAATAAPLKFFSVGGVHRLKSSTAGSELVQAIRYTSDMTTARGCFCSEAACDHELLDLGDCFGRVQSFGAGFGAVHDRVAAIQLERVFQLIQTLTGGFIAAVRNPAVSL